MIEEKLSTVRSLVKAGQLAEALALIETEPRPNSPGLRNVADTLLAELLQAAGRNDEASETAERIRRADLPTGLRARCEIVLGQICLEQEDPARSTKHFQKAIRLATGVGEMRLVCFAQSKLLTTIADISEPGSVLVLMREAQKNVTAFGDSQSAADFHTRVAQIEARRGDHIRAKHHLGAAKRMLRADPNAWLEGSLNLSASAIYFLASDLDEAHRFAQNALSCARHSGHARTRMAATANMGLLDLHLGNLESAEKHLAEALRLCKRFSVSQISLLDSYAQLQLTRGRNAECHELLKQIDEKVSVYEPSVLSWQQLAVGATRLRSLLACDQWSDAERCAAKLIRSADGRADKTHQISLRVLAADALIELGRSDEATTYINAAAELAEDVPVAVFAEIERVRAALHAWAGGTESARRQFERSLRALSAVGGVGPRMDAAMSYLRTMRPDAEIRRVLEVEPWNLGPLTEPTLPGGRKRQDGSPGERPRETRSIEMTDAVALDRLVWRPDLLAQEAFVLLRESGHTTAAAIIERSSDRGIRVLAHVGWSSGEAKQAATNSKTDMRVPVGRMHDRELELLVRPLSTVQAHGFLRDLHSYLKQSVALKSFQEAERAQYSLMSAAAVLGDEDGVFVSDRMRELVINAKRMAKTPWAVLILGETGTGKEVLARIIHKYSDRSDHDFVAYNCTGVPKDMVESQLFGHRRGAFTGAQADSLGVIRASNGGTLLLDEIGELDHDTQPKLLRFLENGEIQPIGESRPIKVDVRVIAATNAKLDEKIRDGRFREDLLYRLNIFTLDIPPLRSRREEILPLAQHFLHRYARESGRTNVGITEDAQKCLLLYEWPGNVRQLDHEIKRAFAMTDGDSVLGLDQLSSPVIEAGAGHRRDRAVGPYRGGTRDLYPD